MKFNKGKVEFYGKMLYNRVREEVERFFFFSQLTFSFDRVDGVGCSNATLFDGFQYYDINSRRDITFLVTRYD